jgi:hypothetical protein
MVATDRDVLSFEVFVIERDGRRAPVATGTVRYSIADVAVVRRTAPDGSIFWEKTLALAASGFSVGVFLDGDPIREHLGLFVSRSAEPEGFSWENFVSDDGSVFIHVQGLGQLRAKFDSGPGPDHLRSVECLTDVTLRYIDDVMQREAGDFSHEVVVKTGSVFHVRA